MKHVSVDDAGLGFRELLAEVEESGRSVVLCLNGRPVADLMPHRCEVSMTADERLGAIKINYDPTEDAGEVDRPFIAR